MKREEKSALSRQRILEAAIGEFSRRGYEGASMSAFCMEHGISKGIVYHHFKDRDELYLLCTDMCFEELTASLRSALADVRGTAEERMAVFYKTWLHFFGEHPNRLGIFSDSVFRTPPALADRIDHCRRDYDALNTAMLMELVEGKILREPLDLPYLAGEFQAYMDMFNVRFMTRAGENWAQLVQAQESRCCQQLDILFYGILTQI